MEVLHGPSDKRTVLVAIESHETADDFCKSLETSFDVIRCSEAPVALELMNERFNDLSATVISDTLAREDDHAFLKEVAKARYFDTIPIVIATSSEVSEKQTRCLEEGAVDIITIPCNARLAAHRINNAIQLRRSTTFYEIESMLHVLPSMIFLKDAEGRYVFSTQYWHHLDTGNDPKWTIRGKTDVDIRKDRENAIKAMEADKEIIRTGKGTSYVIEINADGIQDFVQLIKEPVFDEKGNVTGIIALGNNVTESELMKRKLERYARIDELTNLGNRRAFDEFVDSIPERTDFPIAVISADCDNLKIVNDTFGHHVGDEYLHMAANILSSGIPDGKLAFRVGGDEFIAFVPNADSEQVEGLIEEMRYKAYWFRLDKSEAVISYGSAIIDGPDANIRAALEIADERMYAEKASHKNRSN